MVSSLVSTFALVLLVSLQCSVTYCDNYQNSSLFPSTSSSSAQKSLFINKHILDPSEERNCDYIKWRSKEWSAWLVRTNTQDGILHGSYYGSILRGRNISVIIGEPSLVLGSIHESNSTAQDSSVGTREVHMYVSNRNFTIYHFMRAQEKQSPGDNFVVYELYKICSTSFNIVKTVFGEDRETVQLIVPAVAEGWENQKEDFVILVYFTLKEFDRMSFEALKSIDMGQPQFSSVLDEEAFLSTARNLLHKYPELFIEDKPENIKPESSTADNGDLTQKRLDFQESWTLITCSISAVRSEEVITNLHRLNHSEKYVLFELVKTVGNVAGRWSKLGLLSAIARSLSSTSTSSSNVVFGSINYVLLECAALTLLSLVPH